MKTEAIEEPVPIVVQTKMPEEVIQVKEVQHPTSSEERLRIKEAELRKRALESFARTNNIKK